MQSKNTPPLPYPPNPSKSPQLPHNQSLSKSRLHASSPPTPSFSTPYGPYFKPCSLKNFFARHPSFFFAARPDPRPAPRGSMWPFPTATFQAARLCSTPLHRLGRFAPFNLCYKIGGFQPPSLRTHPPGRCFCGVSVGILAAARPCSTPLCNQYTGDLTRAIVSRRKLPEGLPAYSTG